MASPPASLVTTSLARVTIDTVTEGQHCQTIFDYINGRTTPAVQTDLVGLIAQWVAIFDVHYMACLSPKTDLFSITAAELHFGIAPSAITLYAAGAHPGTAGATNLPLEVAATISKQANLKGRHGIGRISMPAIPNTFTTPATASSSLNAAGLTAYGLLAADMLLNLVTGTDTWIPVISTRPIPPATTIDRAAQIVLTTTRTILGTARRRKLGRGI